MKSSYSLPIYSTEDYTIFKKLRGNRELNIHHVSRLEKTLEQDPEFTKNNPIKVNEKMEVIDGQHRIEAFRRHAANKAEWHPVYYVVIDGMRLHDARRMNSIGAIWKPVDFAVAFAAEGIPAYKTYLAIAKKYPAVQHDTLSRYLSLKQGKGRDVVFRQFRDGTFEIPDREQSEIYLSQFMDAAKWYPYFQNRAFSSSLLRIMQHPAYNHKRMIEQLRKHGKGLASVPHRFGEMLAALHMIYNYDRKDAIDLINK